MLAFILAYLCIPERFRFIARWLAAIFVLVVFAFYQEPSARLRLLGLCAILLVAGIALAFFFSRVFASRIQTLKNFSSRIGAGDFQQSHTGRGLLEGLRRHGDGACGPGRPGDGAGRRINAQARPAERRRAPGVGSGSTRCAETGEREALPYGAGLGSTTGHREGREAYGSGGRTAKGGGPR